jgi:hypothetical protein
MSVAEKKQRLESGSFDVNNSLQLKRGTPLPRSLEMMAISFLTLDECVALPSLSKAVRSVVAAYFSNMRQPLRFQQPDAADWTLRTLPLLRATMVSIDPLLEAGTPTGGCTGVGTG